MNLDNNASILHAFFQCTKLQICFLSSVYNNGKPQALPPSVATSLSRWPVLQSCLLWPGKDFFDDWQSSRLGQMGSSSGYVWHVVQPFKTHLNLYGLNSSFSNLRIHHRNRVSPRVSNQPPKKWITAQLLREFSIPTKNPKIPKNACLTSSLFYDFFCKDWASQGVKTTFQFIPTNATYLIRPSDIQTKSGKSQFVTKWPFQP